MEVGDLHLQRAEAALSPMFLFFQLSPDWHTVSSEAELAAKAFRAASLHEKEAEALRLGFKAEDHLHHPLVAGRILEQVRSREERNRELPNMGHIVYNEAETGTIRTEGGRLWGARGPYGCREWGGGVSLCLFRVVIYVAVSFLQLGDLLLRHKKAARRTSNSKGYPGAAAAAYEEGLHCYTEAVARYKASGQADFAVSLLMRIAEKREKEVGAKGIEAATKAYEEAIDLRMARKELPHASDVYRLYISMLVRVGELQKAIAVMLRRSECLFKLKQYSGVHKAILTVTVLFLALNQHIMADRILSGQEVRNNSDMSILNISTCLLL